MTDTTAVTSSSTLDHAGQDYTTRLTIGASPGAVLEALTSTDALAAWWTPVAGDGNIGGVLTFTFGPGAYVVMRVDAADHEGGVHWTTLACHMADWNGTTVHFEFAPVADGTELHFRHAGLTPRLECFSDCKSGWDHFVPSLQAYVETGVGNPNQSPADLTRRAVREQQRVADAPGNTS